MAAAGDLERLHCIAGTHGVASSGGTTIAPGGGLADRCAAAPYSFAEDNRTLDAVVGEMDQLAG